METLAYASSERAVRRPLLLSVVLALGVGLAFFAVMVWCWPTDSITLLERLPNSGSTGHLDVSPDTTLVSRIAVANPAQKESFAAANWGTLEIVVVEEATQLPISALCGDLSCFGDPDPWKRSRSFQTDDMGRVVLDGLPAGQFDVRLCNGVGGEGKIRLSECTKLKLETPQTVLVTGRVEDCDGVSVPFAQIWLSGHGNSTMRKQITTADGNGVFSFRHTAQSRWVAAFDGNHIRTAQSKITAPAGDSQELVLRFPTGAPFTVRGRLVTPNPGSGLDAVVTLTPKPTNAEVRGGLFSNFASYPVELRGVQDEFEFVGLPLGEYDLNVAAFGYAVVQQTISIDPCEPQYCIINLSEGSTVSGIVIDAASSNPVDGAYVSLSVEGRDGGYAAFSNQDGLFNLVGIPPGRIRVSAEHPSAGQGKLSLDSSGDVRGLRVPLSRGLEISGQVVGLDRSRLQDVHVGMRPSDTPGPGNDMLASVDLDGRFRLWNCERRAYDLKVFLPGCNGSVLIATRTGVQPCGPPVVIELSSESLPSAWLVGRIEDESGIFPKGALLLIGEANYKAMIPIDSRQSAFRIGPFVPGEYEIDAACQGFGVQIVDTKTLMQNQSEDLGLIVLRRPGNLKCTFEGSSGEALKRFSCVLRDKRGRVVGKFNRLDQSVEFGSLSSGSYVLECFVGDSLLVTKTLVVDEGETTAYAVDVSGHS